MMKVGLFWLAAVFLDPALSPPAKAAEVEAKPAKPVVAETKQAEPAKPVVAETKQAEPAKPVKAEAKQAEPVKAEAKQVEPAKAVVVKPPESAESAEVKPPESAESAEVEAVLAELSRGLNRLSLDASPRPYFAQLDWVRRVDWRMEASYGGVVLDEVDAGAEGRVALRVGSSGFDNGRYFGGAQPGAMELSLVASPELTRRKLWLAMDENYRLALSDFADKKRALAKLARNKGMPMSFSPHPGENVGSKRGLLKLWPLQGGNPAAWLGVSSGYRKQLRDMLQAWSRIYTSNAGIEGGAVYFVAQRAKLYHANTESWSRAEERLRWSLVVKAQSHAADGMKLDHGKAIHGFDRFPSISEIRKKGKELVLSTLDELVEMTHAPRLDEDYDGPVMLSPRAAAQLLASTVALHAGGEATPLSEMGPLVELEPQWQKRLSRSVMPDFVDLVDDPSSSAFARVLMDADGVLSSNVSLVSAGMLRNLLMTRVPNPYLGQSNGRRRMSTALSAGPTLTHLVLSSRKKGKSAKQMERELLRRAAEDGYDFGYLIDEFRDTPLLGDVPRETAQIYGGAGKIEVPLPFRVYRIDKSGRRTPVRGALVSPVSMRVLRRIRALGETSQSTRFRFAPGAYGGLNMPIGPSRLLLFSVDIEISTPGWILDGLELRVERGEQQRLPRLPHPFALSPKSR